MKWIDEILVGLIETVGSNNVFEILSFLNINLFTVDKDSPILQDNLSVYTRIGNFECIYVSNEVYNKEFVIAHELGHAILHTEIAESFFNPLLNKGRLENEANYFATKLLYRDLDIEDGIETREQLAKILKIKEDYIKYIVD